ncbi:hypothetical protein U9M48_011506 [Paspalum notatum var. saurae]|uniref:Uncharacterized protein n=1 Tax=Paspalum notatum var. saurae TaxID=547442 RepID=A0AAQ3SVL1_PASNO
MGHTARHDNMIFTKHKGSGRASTARPKSHLYSRLDPGTLVEDVPVDSEAPVSLKRNRVRNSREYCTYYGPANRMKNQDRLRRLR